MAPLARLRYARVPGASLMGGTLLRRSPRGGRGGEGGADDAMSVKYAVLGLLAQRRGYGYDLVQRFEEQVGPAWQLNAGAIYVALDKLEQEGLVRPLTSSDDDAPPARRRTTRGAPRVIYEATAQGLERFEDWMATRSSMSPLREELHLKLALSQPAQPAAPDRADLRAGAGVPRAARSSYRGSGSSFDELLSSAPAVVRRRERDGPRRRGRPPAGDRRMAAPHPRGDALAAGAAGGAAIAPCDDAALARRRAEALRPRLPRGAGAGRRLARGRGRRLHRDLGRQPLRQDDAAARRGRHRDARRRPRVVRRPRPRRAPAPRTLATAADRHRLRVADGAHHARAVGARPRRAAALPPARPRAGAPPGARGARAGRRARRPRAPAGTS